MTGGDFPEYEAGDVLSIRGHRYEVEQVDIAPVNDHIIQYRLTPVDDDAPPARLDPSPEDGMFAFVTYHRVEPEDVDIESSGKR